MPQPEVLAFLNKTLEAFGKAPLLAIPQGNRYDVFLCPLRLALASCGVISVGVISAHVKKYTTASKLAKLWGTETQKSEGHIRAYLVALPALLQEFRQDFDHQKYPELVL